MTSQAPQITTWIWENLCSTPSIKKKRAQLIGGIIAIAAFLVVLPIAFVEKLIAIQPLSWDFK
jgi:hypothetical protein